MSIYLDYNATTPLRPEVWEAMEAVERGPALQTNPSSTHKAGLAAAKTVKEAKASVASHLGAEPDEIVFTGGGSEAINLAIKGRVWDAGPKGAHVITSAVEHHAGLHACLWLQSQGVEVSVLPVGMDGRLDPAAVEEALRPETCLVSLMHVNNEIGTIQPVAEVGRICRDRGVAFHVDAVQALGKVPVNVQDIGCDLLSVSAHKLYGPKGTGALYVRRGTGIQPLIHGGRQEGGLRAGTQNVAGIAGMAEAVRLAEDEREEFWQRAWRHRERLHRLPEELNAVRFNGSSEHQVPHCVSVTFLFCDAMGLATNLSMRGIYVSTGSACSSGDVTPSHVLKAIGLSDQAAFGTLRFSTGRTTTEEELEKAVEATKEIVDMLREITMPEDIGVCDEDCPCFLTV
jgi:cysteine desulfurase